MLWFKHKLVSSVLSLALIFGNSSSSFAEESSRIEQIVTSPETFAVCKAADVLSTIYIIETGIGVEANPVIAWTMHLGSTLGIGMYTPLILISVLMYKIAKDNSQEKLGIAAANAITCGVAAKNLMLIP